MTDHSEVKNDDAVALAEAAARLRSAVPQLARRTMAEYVAGADRFAEFGIPEHLERESTHTVRTVMRVSIAALTETEPPVETAIAEASSRSVDRAADGLPLEEYMRCWQLAFGVLTEELAHETADAEVTLRGLARMRTVFDLMMRQVADSYAVTARDAAAADSRQDEEAIDALWRGDGAPTTDSSAVPQAPLVAHLHVGRAPGEDSANLRSSANARHRKVRQVRAQLRRQFPDIWLMDIREQTGRLVSWSQAEGLGDPESATRALAALAETTGTEVTAAVEPATGLGDVPRAARLSREALETGLRLGRTGQRITMADVALEHHLGHSSTALPLLLAAGGAALAHDDLQATIRAFAACNLDRRATAQALGVHPNTVDNRLTRVERLTGLSVHRTRDLLTLTIGVLAAPH